MKHSPLFLLVIALSVSACWELKPVQEPPLFVADNNAIYDNSDQSCSRVKWGPWECPPNLRVTRIAWNRKWECYQLEELRDGEWYESTTTVPVCSKTEREWKRAYGVTQ